MSALAVAGVVVDQDRLMALRNLSKSRPIARQRRLSLRHGSLPSRRQGRGSDIDDVRPWTFGDDSRHIDRNVTARTGEPHVRLFHDENETVTTLILDLRASMLFGTRRVFRSVAAAEVLALLGWMAAESGGRVGLIVIGNGELVQIPARPGLRAMPMIIHAIAKANSEALERAPSADHPLDGLLGSLLRHLPRQGEAILASSLERPGHALDATLSEFRQRSHLTIYEIEDAFVRQRPAGLYPFLSLAGRSGVAALRSLRASSAPPRWQARLKPLGIPVMTIPSHLEIEAVSGLIGGA